MVSILKGDLPENIFKFPYYKNISLLLQIYMVNDNKVVYKFLVGQLDPLLFIGTAKI